LVLSDARHCVAILPAFSRSEGSGCEGLSVTMDFISSSWMMG
jgi:hypothetical protein